MIPPGRKLEDLIRLSELCVDLLRGNEEFYAEVSETIMNFSCSNCRGLYVGCAADLIPCPSLTPPSKLRWVAKEYSVKMLLLFEPSLESGSVASCPSL